MVKVKMNFLDVICVAAGTDVEETRDLLVVRNTEFEDIINEEWEEENTEYLEGSEVDEFFWEFYSKEEILSDVYCWEYEDRIMCEFDNGERIFIDRI